MEMLNYPCHSKKRRTNLRKSHFIFAMNYSISIVSLNDTHRLSFGK